jgi:hypothetical protein
MMKLIGKIVSMPQSSLHFGKDDVEWGSQGPELEFPCRKAAFTSESLGAVIGAEGDRQSFPCRKAAFTSERIFNRRRIVRGCLVSMPQSSLRFGKVSLSCVENQVVRVSMPQSSLRFGKVPYLKHDRIRRFCLLSANLSSPRIGAGGFRRTIHRELLA